MPVRKLQSYEVDNQEELSQAINEWIHFYNERRIQTKLGNQTPLQYEQNLVA